MRHLPGISTVSKDYHSYKFELTCDHNIPIAKSQERKVPAKEDADWPRSWERAPSSHAAALGTNTPFAEVYRPYMFFERRFHAPAFTEMKSEATGIACPNECELVAKNLALSRP